MRLLSFTTVFGWGFQVKLFDRHMLSFLARGGHFLSRLSLTIFDFSNTIYVSYVSFCASQRALLEDAARISVHLCSLHF